MCTILKFSEAWEMEQGTVDFHMYSYTINTKTIIRRTCTVISRLHCCAGDIEQYPRLILVFVKPVLFACTHLLI